MQVMAGRRKINQYGTLSTFLAVSSHALVTAMRALRLMTSHGLMIVYAVARRVQATSAGHSKQIRSDMCIARVGATGRLASGSRIIR